MGDKVRCVRRLGDRPLWCWRIPWAGPTFANELQMRNLDRELLTRTYSFGAMTRRLDGDVGQMELSLAAVPDADFRQCPGSYPKKISQRAVENISALRMQWRQRYSAVSVVFQGVQLCEDRVVL